MEFRSETAAYLSAAVLAFSLNVTYQRWMRDETGRLEITPAGVSFAADAPKKDARRAFSWAWHDIQRFELSEDHIRILSYKDRALLAGSDQPFDFRLANRTSWRDLYLALQERLDSRFVARIAADPGEPDWQIPVKLRDRGEGELTIGRELIVYRTRQHGDSRTWRPRDIENISTSGEFDLTIQSPERSYEFQLKRPMPPEVYQKLWLRLNQTKGLKLLNQQLETKQ